MVKMKVMRRKEVMVMEMRLRATWFFSFDILDSTQWIEFL